MTFNYHYETYPKQNKTVLSNLLYGILYGTIGQFLSFMQLQASIKYGWHQKYFWLILLVGVPNTWVYMKSVNHFITAFDGEIYPSRLLGFSIGITVFAFMGWLLFNEVITAKTVVCLLLAVCIVLIQVLWR